MGIGFFYFYVDKSYILLYNLFNQIVSYGDVHNISNIVNKLGIKK